MMSTSQPTLPAGSPIPTLRAKRHVSLSIPGDMALYAALAGKEPEIDPSLATPKAVAVEARRENPWSPMVLSIYLRELCRERAVKMNKPELAGWIRRQTETARKRFAESQVRILAATKKRAA
jgi:hypothetical protein